MSKKSTGFNRLRVAAFESRRAKETARLIERAGGIASVSPSMREVPVAEDGGVREFAHRLIAGQVEMVILMTGVGTRRMVEVAERHVDRQRFLDALSDVVTVARGPKPVAALRELAIEPTCRVPEPNTWRELLQTIDEHGSVAAQTLAVQEYGQPNPSLVAGLEARGANVVLVKVYGYDLPEDVAPLERNVRATAEGQIDVLLFTSAQQVVHFWQVASNLDLEGALREKLRDTLIASIGPTTSQSLAQHGMPADFQPNHPKLGQLIAQTAVQAETLLRRKRSLVKVLERPAAEDGQGKPPLWYDSPFMKAARREPCDRVPVWLMRQAGRYMAEYRAVREKTSFAQLCRNPQLCAEVMATAVERLGVDAAIIFSDLLPILEPMGLKLEFAQGEGPLIHNPVREARDVDRVLELENVQSLSFVTETVRETRAAIPEAIPVIGFAGAPFTLASYAIEGGSSRHYLHTKTLMYRDRGAWDELMGRLTRSLARYLTAQIAAGAQAVQIFDSWVGCLGREDYRRFVAPHTAALIDALPSGTPVIHFATGNPALLPDLAAAGGDVMGIDWRIQLDQAWDVIGPDRGIQGNLDPAVLLADVPTIRFSAQRILDQAGGRAGHIFNLGHGVLPQTPVDHVIALVEAVHELGPSAPADS